MTLSNKELRHALIEIGANPGPITDSTRDVWIKKFDKLKAEKGSGKSPTKGSQKIPGAPKQTAREPSPKKNASTRTTRTNAKRGATQNGALDSDSEDNAPILRASPPKSAGRRVRPAPPPAAPQQPKLSKTPVNTIDYTLSKRMSPRKSPRVLEADETPPSARSFNFGESTDEDETPLMMDRSANTSFSRPAAPSLNRSRMSTRRSTTNYVPMTSSPISLLDGEPLYPTDRPSLRKPSQRGVMATSFDSDDISPPVLSSTRREGSWSPAATIQKWLGEFRHKNQPTYQRAPAGSYEFKKWHYMHGEEKKRTTGKMSFSLPQLPAGASRILVAILVLFLVVLSAGYVASAHRAKVAYTAHVIKGAALDTAQFIYHNLVLPILVLGFGVGIVASVYYYRRYQRSTAAAEQRQVFQMVDKIIVLLKNHEEECRNRGRGRDASMAVPHVRDAIFEPAQRSGHQMKIWEKAVDYLNENESRIRTETKYVRGQECMVWTWVPPTDHDEDEKVWMGRAFAGDQASMNIPSMPYSDCLKLRGMFDPELELEENWTDHIQDVLLEKMGPGIRAMHIAVDTDSKEGCVYMKLKTKDDAGEAFKTLHGSWFNGRLVSVKYVRTERYYQRFPDAQRASIPLQVNKPRHSLLWNN